MKQLFFYLTISLLALQACNKDDLCLRGSGTVNEYKIELSEFNAISLEGPVNLSIKQDAEQELVVAAEPEMFGPMHYEVSSKLLDIGYEDNIKCFETAFGVWVNATLPDINAVYVSGASEIESDGDLNLDRLLVDISGTGEMTLSGQIEDVDINTSGTVTARNFDLVTTTMSIDISGSGDLEVTCTGTLDIKVSGAATVRYKGNPQITQDVSGSLNLINAN